MSLFGWSLPAGVGKLPGEEEEATTQPRCRHCKAFLPWKPSREEDEYGMNFETGQQEWLGTTFVWHCKRCGQESRINP